MESAQLPACSMLRTGDARQNTVGEPWQAVGEPGDDIYPNVDMLRSIVHTWRPQCGNRTTEHISFFSSVRGKDSWFQGGCCPQRVCKMNSGARRTHERREQRKRRAQRLEEAVWALQGFRDLPVVCREAHVQHDRKRPNGGTAAPTKARQDCAENVGIQNGQTEGTTKRLETEAYLTAEAAMDAERRIFAGGMRLLPCALLLMHTARRSLQDVGKASPKKGKAHSRTRNDDRLMDKAWLDHYNEPHADAACNTGEMWNCRANAVEEYERCELLMLFLSEAGTA